MAKFNADEQTQIADPIEITIEGKEYTVVKISTSLLKAVSELGTSKDLDAPIKQLAILLGVDLEQFKDVDLRKISKVIEFITTSINAGISQPKNSPGEASPSK